jgi:predicted lipoprotein with Yx(FWY)xxD motif
MSRMKLSFAGGIVVIAAIVAVVIASSGAGATNARSTAPAASAISIKQTSLGKTLVDANGRTVYLFEGDKRDVSTLSQAGRAVWPPFTSTAKPRALNGAVAAHISTIKAANGAAQIAYNGHPLYYYVGDQAPGQTHGQGLNQFGARWYVLAPGGTAITMASSSSTSAPSGGGGASYGY